MTARKTESTSCVRNMAKIVLARLSLNIWCRHHTNYACSLFPYKVRGAYDVSRLFRMGTFIDSTHMKL